MKSLVFAFIISSVAAYYGYYAYGGALDVVRQIQCSGKQQHPDFVLQPADNQPYAELEIPGLLLLSHSVNCWLTSCPILKYFYQPSVPRICLTMV